VALASEASWWYPGERRCKGRATRGEVLAGGVKVSRLSYFVPAHKLSLDSKSETSHDLS
jgi:hypothetical protein